MSMIMSTSQEPVAATGIISRLKRALASGDHHDVEFSVGRQFGEAKTLQAHKWLLSISSDVFNRQFYGSLPEKCDFPIDVPDILPDAFLNMLSFLYTDTVENLNVDNVAPTMYCADKYNIQPLLDLCSEFIIGQLTVDNCLTVLQSVRHLNAVVEKCLEMVDTNSDTVLQSQHFLEIDSSETLCMVVSRNTLSADEHLIYAAVEKWAANASNLRDLDPSPANRREVLGPALYCIRYPQMSDVQLTDGPLKSGLLYLDEMRDIYRYKHATEKPAIAFPAEPRRPIERPAAFQIGEDVYHFGEQVIAKKHYNWHAGRIHGIDEPEFLVEWAEGGLVESRSPQEIVRAADILQKCQEVVVLGYDRGENEEGYYVKSLSEDEHRVVIPHPDAVRDVTFRELVVIHHYVLLWKAQVEARRLLEAKGCF
ncbi:BTB/POZ domain-containing protein 6-like [Paramacrobiotus metropolitanus]|uniref:BTB/POZ domain-containing protein 6-like n=1 Tax=Paramacrobiotus metropolitanus TaxID=2943436 RepID=UPI002445A9A5|nr:BTB/POZ domain-containing protein 6-like [Paramacrobiotus metropolitanus]